MSADPIDRASRLEELERQHQIRRIANQPSEIHATGCCLFCGEPLDKGRRWCDADCRDDWQKVHPHA